MRSDPPKKSLFASVAARVLAGLLLALPVGPASAGLEDALDYMFYSAGASAGAFETQSRYGIAGGAYSVRTPIKPINLVSLDLPSISAGCGGIDLYGGSFSFINLDQFKEMLRQIGSNAAGYAFKLAITEMCKPCAAILASLQKMMTDLNSQFQNTCKIAKQLIDPLVPPDAGKQKQVEEASLVGTVKGAFTDFFTAVDKAFENPENVVAEATNNGFEATDLKFAGNLLWRALWRSRSANMMGDPSAPLGNELDVIVGEGIMNLVGTTIIPIECSPEAGPVPPHEDCKPVTIHPTLTFKDLMEGNPSAAKDIWRCNDYDREMACLVPAKGPFEWMGIRGYVHLQLYGTQDATVLEPVAGSILANIEAGVPLSSSQSAFLLGLELPVYNYLLRLQDRPAALRMVASAAEEPIVFHATIAFAEAAFKAAADAFSGDQLAEPPDFKENLRAAREEITAYLSKRDKFIDTVIQLTELTERIGTSVPGFFYDG